MTYRPPLGGALSPYALYGVDVHSHTFPIKSLTPSGVLPRGKLPAIAGPRRFAPAVFAAFGSHVFPHGYARPSLPRAAASHSSSLGSRPPPGCFQSQYPAASDHWTPVTGRLPSGRAPLHGATARPAVTNAS